MIGAGYSAATELAASLGLGNHGVREPASAKVALRELIRTQRLADSEEARFEAAHDLCDRFVELPYVRRARSVALYISGSFEPGTHVIRSALAARGVNVLLSVINSSGQLEWFDDPAPPSERRSPRHTVTSISAPWRSALDEVSVLLVPALAVDTLGRRLGRGSGCYDTVLGSLGPNMLTLAAVYEREVFDAAVEPVPAECHDVPIDAVITPSRVLRLT